MVLGELCKGNVINTLYVSHVTLDVWACMYVYERQKEIKKRLEWIISVGKVVQ